MANQPIPASDAQKMVDAYLAYMKSLGVHMSDQTHSISFNLSTLLRWLHDIEPYADELRVFPGLYPPGHRHAGRTTVVLWPYKNGKPCPSPSNGNGDEGGGESDPPGEMDPFNEGELRP